MKGTPVGGGYRRNAARAGIGAAVATIAIAAGAGEASANKYQVTTKKADGAGSLVAAVKKTRKNDRRRNQIIQIEVRFWHLADIDAHAEHVRS